VPEKDYDRPAKSSELTPEELEIAQWRIDICPSGLWKIDEIYGEYWSGQEDGKHFGKIFKSAVVDGLLKNISVHMIDGREILASDRQILYRIVAHC